MNTMKPLQHKLIVLLATFFISSQAHANCSDACVATHSSCLQSSSKTHTSRCDEQLSVCTLSCNRHQTMSCVFLGFKNHEGAADKEMELKKVTGQFARVTDEKSLNFANLCRSSNMRCEYVLEWDGTMFSCGGEKRDPRRVACCR